MTYDLTPAQLAWRDEVRDFVRQNSSPALLLETLEIQNEGRGPNATKFMQALRDKGWRFYTFIGGGARFMFAWDAETVRVDELAADIRRASIDTLGLEPFGELSRSA